MHFIITYLCFPTEGPDPFWHVEPKRNAAPFPQRLVRPQRMRSDTEKQMHAKPPGEPSVPIVLLLLTHKLFKLFDP